MAGVLILSSAALTDRVLVHTAFLEILRRQVPTRMWVTSLANPRYQEMWQSTDAEVQPFPVLQPLPEFPHNYLRRLNEFAWDFRLRDPSRLSAMRHIRDRSQRWYIRVLKYPARLIAAMGWHQALEKRIEAMVIAQDRSPEAAERLSRDRPDVMVVTGPFRYEEPAVAATARGIGIPILAFISSWDNISIKGRMVLRYDGYIVWSERMKQELLTYYPPSRDVPIYVVGAPQFDIFFQQQHYLSREEFCKRVGLRPDKPIVLHALGVANGVQEHYGALELARRVVSGELGDVQLIVRPHPFYNSMNLHELLRQFGPQVVVQQSCFEEARIARSQDTIEIREWVNSFRHAAVVVHLSSSVAIDAAIFDRPSICMDYDPAPGHQLQQLVREVNQIWTHYSPIARSGGTWVVKNPDEMIEAIRTYLRHPELHRVERRWMAEYVCGHLDGRCGERMAKAVLNFAVDRKTALACMSV